MFHPIWVLGAKGGGGGLPRDWYTTCSCSFSPWAAQKSKFPKLIFFDIVTTQKAYPSYVKHVLGSIYVCFTLFGYWVRRGGGAVSQGMGIDLLMRFFILGTVGSSKIEVSETYFF